MNPYVFCCQNLAFQNRLEGDLAQQESPEKDCGAKETRGGLLALNLLPSEC